MCQMAVALSSISGRQRRPPDCRDIGPKILAIQADNGVPKPVRTSRVENRTPITHGLRRASGVLPTKVQPIWYQVEASIQGEFGVERPVRVMVAALPRHSAKSSGPDDAILVVVATVEEYA